MSPKPVSTYGGEAVFDGVMMRGTHAWSLAVRLPSGDIHVDVHAVPQWMKAARAIPVVRGVFALAASVVLGIRSLQDSMGYRETTTKAVSWKERFFSVLAALCITGLFLIIPLVLAKLVFDSATQPLAFSATEAVGRLALLLLYLLALGRAKDVQTVFQYHGAEHQTISAREAGVDLTPDKVRAFSRHHPRCGTAFLLLILIIGTLLHATVATESTGLLALSRVLLLPVVAGLTYEFLRLSSRHLHTGWAKVLAAPGLGLQRLTTRPATEAQMEVAIAALTAVVAADVRYEADAVVPSASALA